MDGEEEEEEDVDGEEEDRRVDVGGTLSPICASCVAMYMFAGVTTSVNISRRNASKRCTAIGKRPTPDAANTSPPPISAAPVQYVWYSS